MLTKSLLVLAASAYAQPVEESSGETPCDALMATNFWAVESIRQFMQDYATNTLVENTVVVDDIPVFQQNSEMSFESMYNKYIEDHSVCANTPKLEQALRDIWLEAPTFAGAEVTYNLGRIMLPGHEDQVAQARALDLPANNNEFLEILGLDHEELCDNFLDQEECDQAIAAIANQTFESMNEVPEAPEVPEVSNDEYEEEVEETDDEAGLDEAGILNASNESSDAVSPSIFDNEDSAVGTGSLFFSGSLLLAGAYLL